MKQNNKKKTGILKQLYILVIVVLIVVGVVTYYTQYHLSDDTINKQTVMLASNITRNVVSHVKDYPAYQWLLRYWYEHADSMDIEYDVNYSTGTRTKEKYQLLKEHNPSFSAEYATEEEVCALAPDDQKLFAEVIYSWLTAWVNHIKQDYRIDYLFCVMTDTWSGEDPYGTQFFLFSGADPGAVRGSEYLQVYPLGVVVSTHENASQREVMRKAFERGRSGETPDWKKGDLALAGDYVDYYEYLCSIDEKAVLIGLTYNLSGLRAQIQALTNSGTFYAVLYQFLLLQLILLHLFLFGIRPLKDVLEYIRSYTNTKDSRKITERLAGILEGSGGFAIRNNEIGELSEDIITLANEIDEYAARIEKITAEKEHYEAELSLAAEIQSQMLPHDFPPFPERKEFDLYALMDPAKEVGGDFYDYFLIDDDHLAIVIADVSGKGVPAALFMMASQIVIRNHAMMISSPASALEAVNKELCSRESEDLFVTVWLGILELSTGKLTAANAGHEYPVLKTPDGDFELLKDKHGFVVGGLQDITYTEYELFIKPGSKLFLYTDGVPEATNEINELFGTERMLHALNQLPEGTPAEILRHMREAVNAFVGEEEQFDDVTMVCLEYKGETCFY